VVAVADLVEAVGASAALGQDVAVENIPRWRRA
jgi:hypothetical protein